jgi:hypothetical protein
MFAHSDYEPRVGFRDDTAGVRKKVWDVTTSGNPVWDCTFCP